MGESPSMSATPDPAAVGKRYPAFDYAVGREKIREFALATGETEPLYLDVAAARAAGHRDVVAPPMFAVVYQGRGMWPVLEDPELAIDFPRLLHAGQEFRWGPLVVAGDELTTTVSVLSIRERASLWFYEFAATTVNGQGETVVEGRWRNVVRPREASP
jgi:acyl dehydratase